MFAATPGQALHHARQRACLVPLVVQCFNAVNEPAIDFRWVRRGEPSRASQLLLVASGGCCARGAGPPALNLNLPAGSNPAGPALRSRAPARRRRVPPRPGRYKPSLDPPATSCFLYFMDAQPSLTPCAKPRAIVSDTRALRSLARALRSSAPRSHGKQMALEKAKS